MCQYQKEFRPVDKHGRRRSSLISLVITSHQYLYLTDSNEICLLCSPQFLVVQVQKKIRSVDKFDRLVPGSDLMKNPIDRLVIASPPRPLVRFLLDLGQSVPLNVFIVVQVQKKIRPVAKHGHRRPSLILLVIASPQKLLGGFECNLPIRLASMSSCATLGQNKYRFNRDTHLRARRFLFSLRTTGCLLNIFSFHNTVLCLGS